MIPKKMLIDLVVNPTAVNIKTDTDTEDSFGKALWNSIMTSL